VCKYGMQNLTLIVCKYGTQNFIVKIISLYNISGEIISLILKLCRNEVSAIFLCQCTYQSSWDQRPDIRQIWKLQDTSENANILMNNVANKILTSDNLKKRASTWLISAIYADKWDNMVSQWCICWWLYFFSLQIGRLLFVHTSRASNNSIVKLGNDISTGFTGSYRGWVENQGAHAHYVLCVVARKVQ
jgi:hypothetical protein